MLSLIILVLVLPMASNAVNDVRKGIENSGRD
jgi:hypothetical protein